jgi:uncharacterized protein YdcH (DUF465 family)
MENITTQDDLKAHLMATDETFRKLAEQHAAYKKQIQEIEAKAHLSPQDEDEESRIKKLKLRVKDQMNEIMARYKAQNVA